MEVDFEYRNRLQDSTSTQSNQMERLYYEYYTDY